MQLLITCPKCQTSYKIDEEQVSASDGQARCYNCQHIFDASLHAQPLPDDSSLDRLNLPDSTEVYERAPGYADSQLASEFVEKELSSLFVPEGNADVVTGPDDFSLQDSGYQTPEELLDIETNKLVEIEPLSLKKPEDLSPAKRYSLTGTLGWTALNIILLLAVLAQLGWLLREPLLNNAQARQLAEAACEHITCNLPPRRDPQAFQIIERKVSTHPDVRGILSLSILFSNQADFAQPAPGITLSLFDNRQNLISRRSFSHKDYLTDHFSRKAPLFEAGHNQKVFLNLEDPGPDVTGFEFDFF